MKKATSNRILSLITPSWLSGLISVTAGLVITIGALIITNIQRLNITSGIFSTSNFPGSTNYQAVASNLSKYPIINYLPLYLFWAGAGTIVYFLAAHILKAFTDVVNMEKQLNYVNARRREIAKQALQHFLIRLATLVVWIFFIVLTLNKILPYSLAEVHNVAATHTFHTYLIMAYTAGIIAATLSLHVILLRLLFLRNRLFGKPVYE